MYLRYDATLSSVTDTWFVQNTATDSGGAIFHDHATTPLYLDNVVFDRNTALATGGGLAGESYVCTDVYFDGNAPDTGEEHCTSPDLVYQGLPGPCVPSPCESGGVCTDVGGAATCDCPVGTSGDFCEINPDDCPVVDPCLNGGTCADGVDAWTCDCVDGFSGGTCETPPYDCATWTPAATGIPEDAGITISSVFRFKPGESGTLTFCAGTYDGWIDLSTTSSSATLVVEGMGQDETIISGGTSRFIWLNRAVDMTVRDLSIEGMTLYAAEVDAGDLTLERVAVRDHSQVAILAEVNGASVTLVDCLVEDNTGATPTAGGLVVANGATGTIRGTTFRNNNNTGLGPGAVNVRTNSSLTVEDSRFENNLGNFGGAILLRSDAGSMSVTDSWFGGNFAANAGGALYNATSAFVPLTNTVFDGNFAINDAGAIGGNGYHCFGVWFQNNSPDHGEARCSSQALVNFGLPP